MKKKTIWLVKKNYTKFKNYGSYTENPYLEVFGKFQEAYEKFMEFHKEANEGWFDYLEGEGIEALTAIDNYVNKIEITADEEGLITELISQPGTETVDHDWIVLKKVEVWD